MKYPIGIQTFEKIRSNDFFYIDKTDRIHQLVQEGQFFFLSRPRRFGKSLLLSTIQAYFEGRKDLFEGLKIEKLEDKWETHPVLHLDLNGANYTDADSLLRILNIRLLDWEATYGKGEGENDAASRFAGVIRRAHEQTGRRVVILIDEYDKPLVSAIDNEPLQDIYRGILKGFYGNLKSQDAHIRFTLLTGVTKFSRVSIFSDLNNLNDISLKNRYSTICGITDAEIDETFRQEIAETAVKLKLSEADLRRLLRKTYDGYRFSEETVGVYNPFSLLNALSNRQLGNYWFATGTPTFLVTLLKESDFPVTDLEGCEMDELELNNIDAFKTNPVPVLFQSGYLTIKAFDPESGLYTLGFPNDEVKKSFLNSLLPRYAHVQEGQAAFNIDRFVKDINAGRLEQFILRLQSFFADYNYELIPRHDLERHYHNVLYIVTRLIGLRVEAEYHTSAGRIDMVVKTASAIYLFEFKLNLPPRHALQQIARKDYAAAFAADPRPLVRVGLNFSSETRGIKDWEVEQ